MISEDRIFKPTEVKIADWSKKTVIKAKKLSIKHGLLKLSIE